MLRRAILMAAESPRLGRVLAGVPISRDVVRRFVAGETVESAIEATRTLVGDGLLVSLDHLGEDTTEEVQAKAVTTAYLTLLGRLHDEGLTSGAEVSVKLSAIGQALDRAMCVEQAQQICDAATRAATTVTLDMEDHTTTDSTLEILTELRHDFPDTGAVIQSYLRRSAGDVDDLIRAQARVRLCKGAYDEPASVAFTRAKDVDESYVSLLTRLMKDGHYPMVATHDPRLVDIATELAARRQPGSFEFQMLYGIRPDEQRRLVAAGHRMRVYTPYGEQWFGYLMRRLAERPANLRFFLRALASKS